jgi:hypothetical protein
VWGPADALLGLRCESLLVTERVVRKKQRKSLAMALCGGRYGRGDFVVGKVSEGDTIHGLRRAVAR